VSKAEMSKMKFDLHRLEMQLVQVKKLIVLQDNLRKKQTYNGIDGTTLLSSLQHITEAAAIALESVKGYHIRICQF
jgi:hypothetical protein